MPEVIVWPEGRLYAWTGAGAQSALIAFAQNSQATLTYGWLDRLNVNGAYYNHLTGQRADVSIQALYTTDATIAAMVVAQTAIHLKFHHSGVNGTAGLILYSGYVDTFALAGNDAYPYTYTLTYHAHIWSAYGV